MLSGLRYFEHTLKDDGRGCSKAAFSWGAVDMASVARCFMELCSKAIDVFASEPRLLEMPSPVYVLGVWGDVCGICVWGCVWYMCGGMCVVYVCGGMCVWYMWGGVCGICVCGDVCVVYVCVGVCRWLYWQVGCIGNDVCCVSVHV